MAKRRCLSKAKTTGKRCRRRAVKGMRVCRWHSVAHAKTEGAKVYDKALKEHEANVLKFQASFFGFSQWLVDGIKQRYLSPAKAMDLMDERITGAFA